MEWSELRQVQFEYNDKLRSLDEQLLYLIKERQNLSEGKSVFPPQEVLEEWSDKVEMDPSHINWILHNLTGHHHSHVQDEPGKLLHVLPMLKKTVIEGVEYHITHSMQHENASIVHLEIIDLQPHDNYTMLRPLLQLEVIGDQTYRVRRMGASGGGGRAELSFLVSPNLPQDMKKVELRLIPFANPMESVPEEIILNKEVYFN